MDIKTLQFDFDSFTNNQNSKGRLICLVQVFIAGAVILKRVRVVWMPSGVVAVKPPSHIDKETRQIDDLIYFPNKKDDMEMKSKILEDLEAELEKRGNKDQASAVRFSRRLMSDCGFRQNNNANLGEQY